MEKGDDALNGKHSRAPLLHLLLSFWVAGPFYIVVTCPGFFSKLILILSAVHPHSRVCDDFSPGFFRHRRLIFAEEFL